MAYQIKLPKLTYQMQEGLILEWLYSEGEKVSNTQPLFVVETDKAAIEVTSETCGILLKILVPSGTTVPIDTPVCWIGALGESVPYLDASESSPEHKKRAVVGQSTVPLNDEIVPVEPNIILASPAAKRLARELDIDLTAIQAEVGLRRLREVDVKKYADAKQKNRMNGVSTEENQKAQLGVKHDSNSIQERKNALKAVERKEREKAEFDLLQPTPLQKTMALRLAQSATIPQFAILCEIEFTNMERFRKQIILEWNTKYSLRLTYTHIISKLIAIAVADFPMLNACWTDRGIGLYRTVNLGIAMSSQRGLVIPVVRNAGKLTLLQVAREIIRLRTAVEQNRLQPEDIKGGTFTLTNVGMMGITLSIPILNPGQSGILSIGAKRMQLTLRDGNLSSVPYITITLVADHRVVDGATSAKFIKKVKELLENPLLALCGKEEYDDVSKDYDGGNIHR